MLTAYNLTSGAVRRSDTGIAEGIGRRLAANIAIVLANHPLVCGTAGGIAEILRHAIVSTSGIDLATDLSGIGATLIGMFHAFSRRAVVRGDAFVFARYRYVAADIALFRAHHIVALSSARRRASILGHTIAGAFGFE